MLLDLEQEQFSSLNARQDKIDLELGDWHLEIDEDQLGQFFFDLHAECFALQRHRARNIHNSPPLFWFNRAQSSSRTKFKVPIRASAANGPNRPLVSGHLLVTRLSTERSNSRSTYQLRAILSLNPTRFTEYLRNRVNVSENPAHWQWEPTERDLLTGYRAMPLNGEFSLNGKDNVLLSPASLAAGTTPHWQRHVELYYQQIVALIVRCLQTARLANPELSRPFQLVPILNLRTVQTYFEFSAENALWWVNRAQTPLRALGRQFTSRQYPAGENFDHVDGHALSHTFRITDAIKCTVYAKTDQRIRVELMHDLKKDASVIGTRHTSQDLDNLVPWLNLIADDAGRRVLPVIRAIRQSIEPVRGQKFATELMTKLARAANNEDMAEEIANTLFNLGMLDLSIRPHWVDAVNILVNEDVLVRAQPRRRQYRVTAPYALALEQLIAIMGGRAWERPGELPRLRQRPPRSI